MKKKILFLIIGLFMLLLSGCAYGTYGGDNGYPDYYGDYYYGYPWYGFHEHHEFREHDHGEFEHHGGGFEHHGGGSHHAEHSGHGGGHEQGHRG